MKINEIQDLIKFVSKSGVSEVELETKEIKITIKAGIPQKGAKGAAANITSETPIVVQAAVPMGTPVQAAQPVQQVAAPAPAPAPEPAKPAKAAEPAADDESKYVTVKSPMIGTFYRSPGPDKPTFVNVGDDIAPGKVVCIIEAMKLFNEIESDISGKIVKVLVDDSTPVEYDQPLFLVDPN